MLLVLIGLSYCVEEPYYPREELPVTPPDKEESNPGPWEPTTTTVTTDSITDITRTSAKAGGYVINLDGDLIITAGVCYSSESDPVAYKEDPYVLQGIADSGGEFTLNLENLTPNTLYYARAFVAVWTWKNGDVAYGNEVTFTTSTVLATVTTTAISAITSTTASSGGNVAGNCITGVTERGICWSTSANPTTANSKIASGSGGGSYVSGLTGLTPCTVYHVRAYAINGAGTAYGADVSFTSGTAVPGITTTAVTGITSSGATSGGNITGSCAATVTARGVCYSTSPTPTTANSKTTNGTGGGSYTSNISGLTRATTYYVRAYATNPAGTVYGNEISFTTLAVLPTISTSTISIFDNTHATGGGNVSNDGGAAVTAKGVCWNTAGSPTIANSKTADGTGTGSFTSSLTGLTAGTTYYYRAYATNSIGTAYGTQYSITTPVTLTDVVGNVYNTVSIYGQVWMQQSLRTNKYEDGTSIIMNSDTAYQAVAYYHTYNNNSTYGTTYGYMYNGYAIGLAKDVCPTGWHVPTATDWSTLAANLGGYSSAGAKMNDMSSILNKITFESTLRYWNNSMTGHDNSSKFTARGGGYYFNTFAGLLNATIFWVSTSKRYVRLDYNSSVLQGIGSALYGTNENAFYIRCKKD